MKIAIVGSRNFHNLKRVTEYVNGLPEGTVIISGGARGVDQTAENAARARGLKVVSHKAEWNKLDGGEVKIKTNRYGKQYNALAGFIRNRKIIADADEIVAFWDGVSPGTANTVENARKTGKAVHIYN